MKRLSDSILFHSLDPDMIVDLLKAETLQEIVFSKGETIYEEGQSAKDLALLLDGSVRVYHLGEDGKETIVATLSPGDVFGEALLFGSRHELPAYLKAQEPSRVLFLSKEVLLRLFRNETVSRNFLGLLSEKILMLNRKIQILERNSIRKKIITYLLQYAQEGWFEIPHNREEMSAFLALNRPSLSRELANLSDEGFLEYDRKRFLIKDKEALEALLFE